MVSVERREGLPGWRAVEFTLLFLALPLAAATLFPPFWVWPVLVCVTSIGLVLLAATPGFRWRSLVEGGVAWRSVGLVAGLTAVAALILVPTLVPDQAFGLPRRSLRLWGLVMLLYPLLSALPQELLFRPLFFHRYGGLFPRPRVAVAVNGFVFGLAHLMFWNWIALAMTTAGGILFALGYRRHGFLTAVAMHAVAGCILFTSGLGTFFYHGAVR